MLDGAADGGPVLHLVGVQRPLLDCPASHRQGTGRGLARSVGQRHRLSRAAAGAEERWMSDPEVKPIPAEQAAELAASLDAAAEVRRTLQALYAELGAERAAE